jgi:hypothetical protein
LPPRGTYQPSRTSWGDPAIAGAYNNSDETGIPFERPDTFAGRTLESFTPEELAAITAERQRQTIERNPTLSEFPGATSPMHWFENYFAANSRPWLVADPPDGKVPAQTDEARQRAAARTAARAGRGPADSYVDRSLYDRCITRGLMGSLLPTIYNNGNEIVQGPGFVVIRNEMIHEARVVPLDGRPHLPANVTSYMGDSRGHWEENTLVVVTTNLNGMTGVGGNGGGRTSTQLTITERFTMLDKDTLQYTATIDDPGTWTRPWTLSFPWKREPVYGMFEYACHEGNYAMRNILSISRAAEASGSK